MGCPERNNGDVGYGLGARSGAGFVASLSVEGRPCAARPLRGSCLGTATGLCVHVDSPSGLRAAATSLPGRILVLSGEALVDGVLDSLPVGSTFAAIVVLTGDRVALERIGSPLIDVPCVAVAHAVDQDCVRRAVRVTVTVQDGPAPIAEVPAPRRAVRARRPPGPAGVTTLPPTRTPGTIDLRR
jgi:hypothetical protein